MDAMTAKGTAPPWPISKAHFFGPLEGRLSKFNLYPRGHVALLRGAGKYYSWNYSILSSDTSVQICKAYGVSPARYNHLEERGRGNISEETARKTFQSFMELRR